MYIIYSKLGVNQAQPGKIYNRWPKAPYPRMQQQVQRKADFMTKAELIAQVAEETGLSKAASKGALEAILLKMTSTLKKEGRFALFGLGVFEVVKRKKRMGRNPRTNEPVAIKAHKAIKFKTAKALKDTLN